MTDGPDIGQLLKLLDVEWLDETEKQIVKDTIKRVIKMMPMLMTFMETNLKSVLSEDSN